MRIATLIALAALLVPASANAGAPSTTADALMSVKIHYGQLVRESAFVNARPTYACHSTQGRNVYICRTKLYAGVPRRLRVVSDFLITCDGGPFCWIEKRLITWRYA